MTLDEVKSALPDYAKDLKLNLGSVLTTAGMTPVQIWGTALASAIASRNPVLLAAVAEAAAPHLDEKQANAAKTAAALMGMNNIYYRFLHLVPNPEYKTMPAKLRMNGIASHGIETVDFELFSLAVSAINGCGMCLEAHEHEVIKKGATRELVQNTVRIAAVIHAVAVALEAENTLALAAVSEAA